MVKGRPTRMVTAKLVTDKIDDEVHEQIAEVPNSNIVDVSNNDEHTDVPLAWFVA